MIREAKPGDRVRLTYGDGSSVEGVLREVLELDDGTLHTHTRGQVRRDIIEVEDETWEAAPVNWREVVLEDARAEAQVRAAYPGEPEAVDWLKRAASERGWRLTQAWARLGHLEGWRR